MTRFIRYILAYLTCRLLFRKVSRSGPELPQRGSHTLFISRSHAEFDQQAADGVLGGRGSCLFIDEQESEELLRANADTQVVPFAILNDADGTWGSTVEVFSGERLPLELTGPGERLSVLLSRQLDTLDFSSLFSSEQHRRDAQEMAFFAAADDDVPYSLALSFTAQMPLHSPIAEAWNVYRDRCVSCRQLGGVAFFSSNIVKTSIELILCITVLATAGIFNFVPLLAMLSAKTASRSAARVGVVSTLLWTPCFWALCATCGAPLLIPLHAVLTFTSARWGHFLKLDAVKLYNTLKMPEMRGMQERMRSELFAIMQP